MHAIGHFYSVKTMNKLLDRIIRFSTNLCGLTHVVISCERVARLQHPLTHVCKWQNIVEFCLVEFYM